MTTAVTPPHSGSILDAARELASPAQRMRRWRSRLITVLIACCTGLGAWIVYLAVSMPTGYHSKAWSAAWVGFDILLLLALTGTIVAAMLRRQIVVMLAVFTASLLLCDAWFDIVLDWGTPDIWGSLASAVFAEVPLATFLLFRARKLVRGALRRRWNELGLPGDPPALYRIPLFPAEAPCGSDAQDPPRGERPGPADGPPTPIARNTATAAVTATETPPTTAPTLRFR